MPFHLLKNAFPVIEKFPVLTSLVLLFGRRICSFYSAVSPIKSQKNCPYSATFSSSLPLFSLLSSLCFPLMIASFALFHFENICRKCKFSEFFVLKRGISGLLGRIIGGFERNFSLFSMFSRSSFNFSGEKTSI